MKINREILGMYPLATLSIYVYKYMLSLSNTHKQYGHDLR